MLKKGLHEFVGALAIGLFMVCNAVCADEEVLRQAESFINDGRHADARQILEPLEAEYIGDPRYDYLMGLAFLETGDPGLAVFALQRAIANDPRFAGARVDLGRAYYASGAYKDARDEFERLRDENPPPAARRAIEEYLSLIANRQRRLRMEYRLGARTGYDSNANSATAINAFLGFNLLEESRETSSSFAEFSGNIVILKPLSANLLLDTRLGLRRRNNPDASFVNSSNGDLSVGIKHVTEGVSKSLRLQAYRVDVDDKLNSQGVALAGAWDFNVREKLRVGVLGRVGQTTFGNGLEIKDVDQYLFGVSAGWTYGDGDRASLGGSLLVGSDDPRRSGSRYARDLAGLRFNAGWSFSSQFRAQFTAGLMHSDYDEVFFEQQFNSPRSDTLVQAAVKLDWRISSKWLMSHVVSYANNDTEVDVFAFERVETSLSINRVWR
ncbi:MAG: tetratricopeptide repeat protein [Gammaproteobacteria bacterium]|nr:tetratricopeptide repeat protein [Gammaproteobacteria bacterium]MDH3768577.1 tetratricopeptide repeat protein [Gammaproteobacteria bacterium]